MEIKSITLAASLLVLSTSVHAVVINTLNGVNYEWLELTETAGLSRDQIELRLADSNDILYGYEYSSRSLVEDLFMSYSGFDGLSGLHGAADVVSGAVSFLTDFGHTTDRAALGTFNTVDGYLVESSLVTLVYGIYGQEGECLGTGGMSYSCYSQSIVYSDENATPLAAWQSSTQGWDSTSAIVSLRGTDTFNNNTGSFLVRASVVPVPAAVWLLGSGLIGLFGFARRKNI